MFLGPFEASQLEVEDFFVFKGYYLVQGTQAFQKSKSSCSEQHPYACCRVTQVLRAPGWFEALGLKQALAVLLFCCWGTAVPGTRLGGQAGLHQPEGQALMQVGKKLKSHLEYRAAFCMQDLAMICRIIEHQIYPYETFYQVTAIFGPAQL